MLPIVADFLKIDPKAVRAFIRASISTNKEQDIGTCNFPCSFNPNTNVCRSTGVEVGHLEFEHIAVLEKAENYILEEYKFIPYVSNYTPTDSSNLQYSQYFLSCQELVKKIEEALKKNIEGSQFQAEGKSGNYLDEIESSDGKYLFKILETISTDSERFKNKRKEYLETYSSVAGKDILNNVLVNEYSLKIMLEIILENTYRKLNILELNNYFPFVLDPLTEIVEKYSLRKFRKGILIAPESVDIDQEILKKHGLQQNSKDSLEILARGRSQDVAISSFTFGPLCELKSLLHTLTSVVKPNGFVLLFFKEKTNEAEKLLYSVCGEQIQVHSTSELELVLQSQNLFILSKISDPFGGSIYLLRPPNLEEPQKILKTKDENYNWVEKVKTQLYGKDSGTLWLVSENSTFSGILGMVNCLRKETGGERIRCIFISCKKQNDNLPSFSMEHPFFHHLIATNLVMNVWRNGTWGSYRYILLKETKPQRLVEHSYVSCRKYGDLSSFEWIESRVKYSSRRNRKLVHIYYSAVNNKDVILATGKLSIGASLHQHLGNSVLGFEFSGREEGTGKRICGFTPGGALATSILADSAYCLEVPQDWTLEEAATVPVVYATCYYALIERADLQPGESILIHSGSDGIGLAAITIALSLKCEVFTTVDNEEKRVYLKMKYPQIKDENIGCSRNISFESMILSRTNGRGVDVILTSVLDDKYQANFRCITRRGRIIELGRPHLGLDCMRHSKKFLKNASLHAVFFDDIFDMGSKGRAIAQNIMDMVREGIEACVVQPLVRNVFGRNAIEDAFRYMAKGVHVGKVLLQIRDEEPGNSELPKTLVLPAKPETHFYCNKVYIIIGGLGGFGMEVTKWAIDKGARNIILTSKYGAGIPYHKFCLKKWKDEGLNIQVSTLNVAKENEAEKLLKEAMGIGSLGGIFNSASVSKYAFMDVQTPEDYKTMCGSKSVATKILDELTRKLCPDIDYFVCFSSIVAGRGNACQTSYGYANSVMERICEERRKDGINGLAIQWGIIGDMSVVHRHMGDYNMIFSTTAQSVKRSLHTLDVSCQQDCSVVASHVSVEQNKEYVRGNALNYVVKILGFGDIIQTNMTRRLCDIGIHPIVGAQIQHIIEYYSDIDVTMQEIWEMKLEDIKAILEETDSKKSKPKAHVLMATTNMKVPAMVIHKHPLVLLNKDGLREPIFIVYLKDTDVMIFQPLAKVINRSVYALVWTMDLPSTCVESIAEKYLKLISNITDGPYHLIGVSEGACLAFEMTLQSERSQKLLKSLTLINGSKPLMNKYSVEGAEKTESEVTALCDFIEQFMNSGFSALKEELQKELDLDRRITAVLNYLTHSCSEMVNKEEIFEAIVTHLQKHRILNSYIPSGKISSDINLLEDSSQLLAGDVPAVKEIFTQFCTGNIAVQRVISSSMLSSEDVVQLAPIVQSIV